MQGDDAFLDRSISLIYDCAVDPSLWSEALDYIRMGLDTAFVSLQFITFPDDYPNETPSTQMFCTDWDMAWFEALQPLIPTIPFFEEMRTAEIDLPRSQMEFMDEAAFHETSFYEAWVRPQGLRDTLNTNIIQRDRMTSILSMPSFRRRDLFTQRDRDLVARLAPHMRRALLIADLLDEKTAFNQVLQATLDRLSSAVFLVNAEGRLSHMNAAADTLLAEGGALTAPSKRLMARSAPHRDGLATAFARACTPRDMDIETWGNGIPLPNGRDGTDVAYVLPLGRSERRNALGPGLAAVFVTSAATAQPPSVEIVSAVTGLTVAEARVALAVAQGVAPQEIAKTLGVSINTVRKHLASAYSKTGLTSQAGLAAAIARLEPRL